jgi:hypothetical protein
MDTCRPPNDETSLLKEKLNVNIEVNPLAVPGRGRQFLLCDLSVNIRPGIDEN